MGRVFFFFFPFKIDSRKVTWLVYIGYTGCLVAEKVQRNKKFRMYINWN